MALRKEFRFRRLNDTRNQLYNMYSYEPEMHQQYALHLVNEVPEPSSANRNKFGSVKHQTFKNLPPLNRAPEIRH